MPSFHRGRFAVGAAAAISTLALAGCGSSGVMHDGSTALTYDGHTVTSEQLQTATQEINAATNFGVDPKDVAQVLAVGPQIVKLGKAHGVVYSDSYIRTKYHKVKLSDVAVQALRVSDTSGKLGDMAVVSKKDNKKIAQQDASLNPRYGKWVKGSGPTDAPEPWISAPPATAAVPNGHPATQ